MAKRGQARLLFSAAGNCRSKCRPPGHAIASSARQEKAPGPTPDGGLVLELLRAALHSRAAYGYAMQAGHVSSVLNFALMHAVHFFRCGSLCLCLTEAQVSAAWHGRAAQQTTEAVRSACSSS